MDLDSENKMFFSLLDLAGVGLMELDTEGRIIATNDRFHWYLDLGEDGALGSKITGMTETVGTPEFIEALGEPGDFCSLVPGTDNLLLAFCRQYTAPGGDGRRFVLLRPYSLEREFIRMRSHLNRNIALEISAHLSSAAIASEIILQPELQDDQETKERFLTTFLEDISNLSENFNELQEIAEPIPFPARIHPAPMDWKGLVTDLISKIRGLASDRNVSISCDLPSPMPTPYGAYHWLYLALYGILDSAVNESAPLGEVGIEGRFDDSVIETSFHFSVSDGTEALSWPPPTLFRMGDGEKRACKIDFSNLALSRSIILLHRGSLEIEQDDETRTIRLKLPL